MEFFTSADYNVVFWSGSINDMRLRLDSCRGGRQRMFVSHGYLLMTIGIKHYI